MRSYKDHFGIIAEFSVGRISIFDTRTQTVLQQIEVPADVIDVALTSDDHRAVVSSFNSKTIFQVDLCVKPAKIIGSATTSTFLEDIQLTPDNLFAVSVDGSAPQNIVSYSLKKNAFVSTLPANAQAVAVSPKSNGLILTAVFGSSNVHRYRIDHNGIIIDTGQDIPIGSSPININFSPSGNFAFVTDFNNAVSVLSTTNPDNISLISTIPASTQPQSMTISRNGRYVFVLGAEKVDIFNFDPVSANFVLARSFTHGLNIQSFFGVDQIALAPDEPKLFISAVGQLAVFTTYGLPLGTVPDVTGPGGLAVCPCRHHH